MSAIVGFFCRNQAPAQRPWLNRMMTAVAHRGGDDQGMWCEGSVAMGHHMLWVTPESQHEMLPLLHGDIVLTADARIDNREELWQQLNISPAEGRQWADSRLILAAYNRWGLDCPQYLIGDFAFALWDSRQQRLLCVRDPMGIKQLFYYQTPTLFAFSTTIQGILTLPGVTKCLNEKYLAQRLIGTPLTQLDPELTYFQGIHHVRAAHGLVIESDQTHSYRYWCPDKIQPLPPQSDEEYIETFRTIFTEAVTCRLRSAYPVASLLSGGLDSSSIVCVAAPQLRQQGRSLSVVSSTLPEDYQGGVTDEREFIQLVCKQENLTPQYVTTTDKSPYLDMDSNYANRERLPVSTYYVYDALQATATGQGARTLLDGLGGELGPTDHGRFYLKDLFITGQWLTLWQELQATAQQQSNTTPQVFARKVLRPLIPTWHKYPDILMRSPIHPDFLASVGLAQPLRSPHYPLRSGYQQKLDVIKVFQMRSEASSYYPLEMAYPYFDRRVLEFCLAMPAHLRFQKGWGRYLIRQSMTGILPQKIQWRRCKQPFSPSHYDKLLTHYKDAERILNSVQKHEVAYHYLDIQRILHRLKQYDLSNRNISDSEKQVLCIWLRHTVQQGVAMVNFLRWFEQLGIA